MIVNPPSVVLASFLNEVENRKSVKKWAQDTSLSYQEGLTSRMRYQSTITPDSQDVKESNSPFMVFNRSVIRVEPERFIKRSELINGIIDDVSESRPQFQLIPTKFEFMAKIYFFNIVDLEEFEIEYLMGKGLRGITEVSTSIKYIPEDIRFSFDWKEISDIETGLDDEHYLSLSLSAEVNGPSLYYMGNSSNIIKTIKFDINNLIGSANLESHIIV